MPAYTVLLTCIGGVYARDTIEALRLDTEHPVRIVGADADASVVNRFAVDVFVTLPSAAADANAFVGQVLDVCRREGVSLVLPSADEEVLALAAERARLNDAGIECAVHPLPIVRLLRNKLDLFDHLSRAHIALPQYARVATPEHLIAAAPSLGYPDAPVVLKPSVGRGARGLTIVDAGVPKLHDMSGPRGHRRGPLDEVVAALGQEGVPEPLIAMELLPGPAFDVDCLAASGEAICVVVRRRLWRDPFSPSSQGCRIERHQTLERLVSEMTAALGLDGVADFDFGSRADGSVGLFEVNPRWSGAVAASLGGQVNLPALLVRRLRGLPTLNTTVTPGASMFPVTRMSFVEDPRHAAPEGGR